jgi:8-oxo-dGTP pyrophosphatase MutT (NUDIX family)
VGAAILREGRILLLQRSPDRAFLPGLWDIPGGHVKEGETLEAALRREVVEETGFAVNVANLFSVWTYDPPGGDARKVHNVEVDFHCPIRSRRSPRIDPSEHARFAWVDLGAIRRFPTHPALSAVIRTAFRSRATRSGPERDRTTRRKDPDGG